MTLETPQMLMAGDSSAWLIGSFLNVVIHRLPRGQSLVCAALHVPGCGSRIRPIDNVPVAVLAAARRQVPHCSAPISSSIRSWSS